MASRGPRTELTLTLPLAMLLLALVSGFTLFAYRQSIDLLLEDRRQEADLLARSLAARLAGQGWTSPDTVKSWVPQAKHVAIHDGGQPVVAAVAEPGAVAGASSFVHNDRSYQVRLELDASRLLSRQATLRQWTPALAALDLAIIGLALLALRRLMRPIQQLLAQSRPADAAVGNIEDEIARLVERTEQERKERLAESLRRLGEMAGGVAHEMRNSLATLRGYLGLIERDPRGEGLPEYLGEIRRESDQLQRVLDDFLTFARPGEQLGDLLDLRELVERAAADPSLGGKAVEIVVEEGADWRLLGDRQLLERALRNLFRNASEAEARAARAASALSARLRRVDGGLELRIEDRGDGVPAALRERLFQPFATGHAQGVGLGLALSRRIVVLHGGRLELHDRSGGGTVAELVFPAPVLGKDVTRGNMSL